MSKSIETDDSSTPDSLTWKKEFRPLINGKPVRWDDLSVVLMTGEKCTLALEYEYSYYIGAPEGFLALNYKPGEEGQGLVFDPLLGVECEMAEGSLSLSWTLSAVEGPGGAFELVFTLPRDPQISESPPVPGRVIENWSEGFVPWINGQRVSWSDVKLDLMQGETCTLALSYEGSSLIGDPAGFLALDYMPGAEGQGLVFDPPLGVACEMTEGTTCLSWTITSEQARRGPFELQFALPKLADVPKSPSLPGRLIDSWLEGFSPLVSGKQVEWTDLKLDLMAGETIKLALDFKNNWLIGHPAGFLALEYAPGAEGQGLVFDPPLGTACEMAEGTSSLSWTIASEQGQSGSFELQFALPEFATMLKSPSLPGRKTDLQQELELMFDAFSLNFGRDAYPCHGAVHKVSLRLKPDSPLSGRRVILEWEGESAEDLGVVVTPALELEQTLDGEWLTWELDFKRSTKNSEFSLKLSTGEHQGVTLPLAMSLGHNLVTTERWQRTIDMGWGAIWTYFGIRATSSYLKQPAPLVEVTVKRTGLPPVYQSTTDKGEVEVLSTDGTIDGVGILNRYDRSYV
ncbi:hypothetical protein PHLH6_45430 [Pseudomonas sp. Seg1]|uniref:hypothetical protein n=1 Tax=Pseudomonas sp. Seg1 TaxID=2678259 RepID=UPI001BB406A9|nr:hypothetical protein [Pseudomonas sp. Seg1]BBP72539.1 hypothetical protein PHLH6_45430 [Pseudomonas sp. Seg1]